MNVSYAIAPGAVTSMNIRWLLINCFFICLGTFPPRAGQEDPIQSSSLTPSVQHSKTQVKLQMGARGLLTGTAVHAGRWGPYLTLWPIIVGGPYRGSLSRQPSPLIPLIGCDSFIGWTRLCWHFLGKLMSLTHVLISVSCSSCQPLCLSSFVLLWVCGFPFVSVWLSFRFSNLILTKKGTLQKWIAPNVDQCTKK